MMIRLEEEKDFLEVENLKREAFWNVYRPGCVEHFIANRLRNDECFVKDLDYIIEEDNKIIANIMYAKSNIIKKNGELEQVLLFGPVSVLPEYQKKGYGEKLINYTIEKAKKMNYPAIVITGNPQYYRKFGFESASKYNIYYEGMPKDDEFPFFMIKILDSNKIADLKGVYADPKCYIVDEKDVEKFDKKFPYKKKEIVEGQLF